MQRTIHHTLGLAALGFGLCAVACSGGDIGTGSGGAGGAGAHGGDPGHGGKDGHGGAAAGGNGGAAAGGNGGNGGSGAGPACGALGDAVQVSTLAVSAAASARAVTAQRGEGSVVAWAGSDGAVHVLPLDAGDAAAGAELTVEGTQVFGVAATQDDIALLVARAPDYMTFVRIDGAGQKLASVDFVGGGDHDEVGVEWFGEFARTGRLVAQGDGTYAAYHALHRRWPDNIGHQGDTLRVVDKDGKPSGNGWDWGCSHGMDQRLAFGPTGLVPICISDCYPEKGIWFRHNGAKITDDPGANCAGGFTTALGGLTAVQDGFFLVYQDAQNGAHLGHFDGQGKALSDRSLVEAGTSRLARYEDGLLLGSAGAAGATIEKLDAAGAATGEKTEVAAALPDQDFESRSDGEVAWATVSGTMLTVVRVRTCP